MTPRGRDALKGQAHSRGTSKDYIAHVLDQPVESDVTSWTNDEAQARRFGDIILTVDEDDVRDRIVPHPLPNRYPEEQEVLIRGSLYGLKRL